MKEIRTKLVSQNLGDSKIILHKVPNATTFILAAQDKENDDVAIAGVGDNGELDVINGSGQIAYLSMITKEELRELADKILEVLKESDVN